MPSKTAITPNNIHGWLAALGYIFPSTEGELLRFEKLCAEISIPENELIDPEVLLGRKPRKQRANIKKLEDQNDQTLKMAARNGVKDLPKHILDKMKRNQQKPPNDDGQNAGEKIE